MKHPWLTLSGHYGLSSQRNPIAFSCSSKLPPKILFLQLFRCVLCILLSKFLWEDTTPALCSKSTFHWFLCWSYLDSVGILFTKNGGVVFRCFTCVNLLVRYYKELLERQGTLRPRYPDGFGTSKFKDSCHFKWTFEVLITYWYNKFHNLY